MPAELKWQLLNQKGTDCPGPRSGHSLTWVGGFDYVMYGGLETARQGTKIVPATDVYNMKLSSKEVRWTKLDCNGETFPRPRTQHVAMADEDKKKIFIFGGHANQTTRLNDCWLFEVKTSTWTRVEGDKDVEDNSESPIGAPPPRANAGATLYNNKVYIYGGHGGLNHARSSFSDIWHFDLNTLEWHRYEPVEQAQPPPEGRGGNSIFVIDDKLYSYGGWNSDGQFSNLVVFDLNTREWSDPDIQNGVARWNHSAVMVEAIPSWKYFIFGGESSDFGEAQPRAFGELVNTACFLDIETLRWAPIFPEDSVAPKPREYAGMSYDHRESRLIVFGGWNNRWLNDMYALNVSKIVGPPYAVTSIEPATSQLSGGTEVTVRGCGFKDQNIRVFFSAGDQPISAISAKTTKEVPGTYVSETEMTCLTPNFDAFGATACCVQLTIAGGDLTTTFSPFSFFMNTRAFMSLCYGPAIQDSCAIGAPAEFVIQARNDNAENRTSGNDNFVVKVTTNEEEPREIEATVVDRADGSYFVSYTCDEPVECKVSVMFKDDKGKMVAVRGSPYSVSFEADVPPANNAINGPSMPKLVTKQIETLQQFMKETSEGAKVKGKDLTDLRTLIAVKDKVETVHNEQESVTLKLDQLEESIKMLQATNSIKEREVKSSKKLVDEWNSLKKLAKETKKEITPLVEKESKNVGNAISKLDDELAAFNKSMRKRDFYLYDKGVKGAKEGLAKVNTEIETHKATIFEYKNNATKFGNPELIETAEKAIEVATNEVAVMSQLWQHIEKCVGIFDGYMAQKWMETNADQMEEDVKKLQATLKSYTKVDKRCSAYIGLLDECKKWLVFLPMVTSLRSPNMRDRHWASIKELVKSDFKIDENLILKAIYDLNLGKFSDDVEEITDQAGQEARMEKTLKEFEEFWVSVDYDFDKHKGSEVMMLRLNEENFEKLEEHQTLCQAMFSSRYLATFEEKVILWQKQLAAISEITQLCQEIQRTWSFLENLFIHSEEVKKELPAESEQFKGIDSNVKRVLNDAHTKKKALDFCVQDWVLPALEQAEKELKVCEKALYEFMEGKRRAFPRFYFCSTTQLLDILSNGNSPSKVMEHMPAIFLNIATLELKDDGERPKAVKIISGNGPGEVDFYEPLKLVNKVENYLQDVIDAMRETLRRIAKDSLVRFKSKPKKDWMEDDPAQISLLINMVQWCINVDRALETGTLQEAYEAQVQDLTDLIRMVQGDLTRDMRQKIMCLITMDAHSRDIILKLKNEGVTRPDSFQWQCMLKFYWLDEYDDYRCLITDASFHYGYEYLGNGPRLVVTPLTDRIYVTSAQALHLKMGCAPAGPAGTGKTETVKDLSNALARPCYVFNCSSQMDYKGMGGIFKGLASSGSYGCFDEFNRLLPSVLSVCAVQFKAVTDAVKGNVKMFLLQDDNIRLDPSCGVFITMNPGYLGRAELPEGLKTLFRPITVVVPDLQLICENMLMAEGFVTAKELSTKFTTLYALCKDLLSKQMHYDWGLRAIKSVLVVAGGFKRGEPDVEELALLMRALRDFNLPKIVAEDLEIFHGLLGDLFPGMNPERKRNMEFEKVIADVVEQNKLFAHEQFVEKVVQLKELLEIRHSVFILGASGGGKSKTWQMLAAAQTKVGEKTMTVDLNPKVVNCDELYGVVHIQTREWIDGLMSNTMRRLGQIPDTNPKWIILDGDLSTEWVESMNSVMDDNKILTLASNERIPLKPHMKLIFEIRDLRFASPATVSRAGILYISDFDGYQWESYVKAWIKNQNYDKDRKQELQGYFDQYIPEAFKHMKKTFKFSVPTTEISLISSLCSLLQAILASSEVSAVAFVFVFCCVWCLGGGFDEKDGINYRRSFSNWWKDKFKTPRFPSKGSVFDYYVDLENSAFAEWSQLADDNFKDQIDTSKSISNYTVPTPDTIGVQFIMKRLLKVQHSPMLIGQSGCGKTQIIKGLLDSLVAHGDDGDEYLQQIINFNYYTDSTLLQVNLEQQIEKRAGITYGPVGKYKLIWFIDDINLPMLDEYDTQTAIALVRQHKDYEHWYNRTKLTLKVIKSCIFVAAMNPTAGSFHVNPRLQRHFWTCSITFPESTSLFTIFNCFLQKHFSSFKSSIQELIPMVIKTTIALHGDVERNFRKTAINFHYQFNVRHLTNIFQGILAAQEKSIKEPDNLVKLWTHECERIYGDRLVNAANLATYREFTADTIKKAFPRVNMQKYFQAKDAEPLVFANFVVSLDERCYEQFESSEQLSKRLTEALNEYNDTNAAMDLVLFEDAMKHCCKVARIIANDGGHALLVGVGGSGKQSLSRLATFICQYNLYMIMISSSYSTNDLKEDLRKMYTKAGVKSEGTSFLFTEGQITNERFLVFINDLLASGEIADLFPPEDVDGIVNQVRAAAKGEGIIDTAANCWKFFIDRVRTNLHMCICFSPVGEDFRTRSRKFPALINSTVIDWFHPWPYDALLSVAAKFLEEVEFPTEEVRQSVVKFMPYSFELVDKMSARIKDQERRFIYTTPKSFLELIALFKSMIGKKQQELEDQKSKYEVGVVKLNDTAEIVAQLEADLKVKSVEVEALKKSANEQAEIVGVEKAKVDAEASKAEIEAAKCNKIATEVKTESEKVQADLDMALPLVEQAKEALNSLKVEDFRMVKAYNNPPGGVRITFIAVLNLLVGVHPDVPTTKQGKLNVEESKQWQACLKLMGNPEAFMEELKKYKEVIDTRGEALSKNFNAIRSTIADEAFVPEKIATVAKAAGGVCTWVKNITMYYDVVVSVEPKKLAVAEMEVKLKEANQKRDDMNALVAKLQAELQVLLDKYNAAMKQKQDAEDEADRCAQRLDRANRLVNSLGSESERWQNAIVQTGEQIELVSGDVLLAASFVSYVGPFNKQYRDEIIAGNFVKFFQQNGIPFSPAANPLASLTNEAVVAEWNNDKLPSDRVSVENGAILSNSARYPLIIDPQMQGILWLRTKERNNDLQVTRLTNPKMVKVLELAIESGKPVLMENLMNTIDAVIQPIYARAIIKKGKSRYIKMGDKELNLHPKFMFYMHTKLSNPHYAPEIQAECTLINFTVTESGLEDQLLALIVKKERPDLAAQKEEIIQQNNTFMITLKNLEDDLLRRLSEQEGDILEDIELIENLEKSKVLSTDIKEKMEIAKVADEQITLNSEQYRPAANRGALVFFLLNDLFRIHSFYKFSLDAFVIVVKRAIDLVAERMRPKKEEKEEGSDEEGENDKQSEDDQGQLELTPRTLKSRVEMLIETITYEGFDYTRRGTLVKHKLILAAMLCFKINVRKNLIKQVEVNALIKKSVSLEPPSQPESLRVFIPENSWAMCKGLEENVEFFKNFMNNLENETIQWKRWYGEERPEAAELPKSYKDISPFHRLFILRALRPDRLSNALSQYVSDSLGVDYVEAPAFDPFKMVSELTTKTAGFFVLFPGVDPTPDVEKVGATYGKAMADRTLVNISMGQGQEAIAVKALHEAAKKGNWIMIQNTHLMAEWMKEFEMNLEIAMEEPHEDFRCFITSEPPPLPMMEICPESILQNSVKVADEAPSDLKANMRRAMNRFDQAYWDKAKSHQYIEFKAILFGLITFHSLILGRRKFGSQGWSRHYSFNDGDLSICGDVLHNYLSNYEHVPYEDIRYIYGEIMYGGHITDNWDRRTCATYLQFIIRPEILRNMQLTLGPGFRSPDPEKYDREDYARFLEERLPTEQPLLFGLHANAEINYLTDFSETVMNTILVTTGGGGGGGGNAQDQIAEQIALYLSSLPPNYNMLEIKSKIKEMHPYIIVALQECERMNTLMSEMKKSLNDLDQGLKGNLNITDAMEDLTKSLTLDQIPGTWAKAAYASNKMLGEWLADLKLRCQQLTDWTEDCETPTVLWIAGLFNPMSFLTAIMQVTSRAHTLPLDDICLHTEVKNSFNTADFMTPEGGAYVNGFFFEGANWECGRGDEQGYLIDMTLKELKPICPVIHVTAIQRRDRVTKGIYECPVYMTCSRGATNFIFTADLQLETEEQDVKTWILRGCALVLQPE